LNEGRHVAKISVNFRRGFWIISHVFDAFPDGSAELLNFNIPQHHYRHLSYSNFNYPRLSLSRLCIILCRILLNQITAEKDTIFALLTGAILGPLTIYQLLQMLPLFPLNIAGLLVTSTLIYFVPALTALLLAKHKEKEMINAQPERPT
jgi:hypothetical protein